MIPITSTKTLGQVLRKYRKDHGLSQVEVAKKYNLTQKMISNIESGLAGVQLGTLFKLISALGLEIHLEPRNNSSKDEVLW